MSDILKSIHEAQEMDDDNKKIKAKDISKSDRFPEHVALL
jgi:hypothetical protein